MHHKHKNSLALLVAFLSLFSLQIYAATVNTTIRTKVEVENTNFPLISYFDENGQAVQLNLSSNQQTIPKPLVVYSPTFSETDMGDHQRTLYYLLHFAYPPYYTVSVCPIIGKITATFEMRSGAAQLVQLQGTKEPLNSLMYNADCNFNIDFTVQGITTPSTPVPGQPISAEGTIKMKITH